jgi:hypothetical protein
MIRVTIASLAFLLSASMLPVVAQTNWEVTKTFHIGGEGGWDYLTVDAKTHRLFVPRSTHTMVIDADSGRVLGTYRGRRLRTASRSFPAPDAASSLMVAEVEASWSSI